MAMQSLAMQDRIVVVTRAGNGIGRSVALLLGAQDARVEFSDLALNGSEGADAGPAQQEVNEITSTSGMAAANTDSVATPEGGLVGNLGHAHYAAAELGIAALSKSVAQDMARFHVRSNCIAPLAWSSLIGTLPSETGAEKRRLARIQSMKAEPVAAVDTFLPSDAAHDVNGHIRSLCGDEVRVMSHPSPAVSVHSAPAGSRPCCQSGPFPRSRRWSASPHIFN